MHWCEFKFSLFFLSLCLLLHCIQCVKHCSISLNENFKSISSILCHSYTERLLYQVSKCLNWFSLSLSTNNNERFNARKRKEKCLNFLNFQLFIRKKRVTQRSIHLQRKQFYRDEVQIPSIIQCMETITLVPF